MEKELRDQLTCPICFEIPTDEVLQCPNGHTLCSLCYSKLTECPQCRVQYKTEKCRNLFAEAILDSLEFNCKHEDKGCSEKMKRSELVAHGKKCVFSKPLFQLCRCMGIENCEFSMNSLNAHAAVQHFQSEHHFVYRENPEVEIYLGNFTDRMSTLDDIVWEPVILKLEEGAMFLMLIKYNGGGGGSDQSVSFICVDLMDSMDYEFEGKIHIIPESNEIPDLKWTISPVELRYALQTISTPPLRMPLSILKEYCTSEDSLPVRLSIRKTDKTKLLPVFEVLYLESTWSLGSQTLTTCETNDLCDETRDKLEESVGDKLILPQAPANNASLQVGGSRDKPRYGGGFDEIRRRLARLRDD